MMAWTKTSSQMDSSTTAGRTSSSETSQSGLSSPSMAPSSYCDSGSEEECYSQKPYNTASDTLFPVMYIVLMMVIALVGNILVLFIFNCRWRSAGVTKVYVSALAVLDILAALIVMPRDLITFTFTSPRTLGIHCPNVFCQVVTYAGFIMHFASGIILVAIAASRYLKVTGSHVAGGRGSPFKKLSRFLNTYRGAKVTSLTVFGVALVLTFPSALMYENKPDTFCFFKLQNQSSSSTLNSCYLYCAQTTEPSKRIFVMVFLIFNLTMFACIFVSLIMMYVAIGYHLRASERDQRPWPPLNPDVLKKSRTDLTKSAKDEALSVSDKKPETPVNSNRQVPHTSANTSQEDNQHLSLPPVSYSSHAISSALPKSEYLKKNEEDRTNLQNFSLPSVRDAKQKIAQTRKKTLTMMIITVIFILSYLPFLSLSIANQVTGGLCSKMSPDWLMTAEVFWRSFYISNAANPIVYGFCNPTFRKVLWKTLSWRAEII